jgi:hypothetical protein
VPSFFTVTVDPGATDGDAGLSLNSVSEIEAVEDVPPLEELCRFSPQPASASTAARAIAGAAARITAP